MTSAAVLAERLSRMVRVPTVTPLDGPLSPEKAAVFTEFKELLYELYPTVFATAEVTEGSASASMIAAATGSASLSAAACAGFFSMIDATSSKGRSAGITSVTSGRDPPSSSRSMTKVVTSCGSGLVAVKPSELSAERVFMLIHF